MTCWAIARVNVTVGLDEDIQKELGILSVDQLVNIVKTFLEQKGQPYQAYNMGSSRVFSVSGYTLSIDAKSKGINFAGPDRYLLQEIERELNPILKRVLLKAKQVQTVQAFSKIGQIQSQETTPSGAVVLKIQL